MHTGCFSETGEVGAEVASGTGTGGSLVCRDGRPGGLTSPALPMQRGETGRRELGWEGGQGK